MLDVTSGKVQMSIGIPTLLLILSTVADYRYIDTHELNETMDVAMNQVTRDRREDKLYSINQQINRLEVIRDQRQLRPEEHKNLLDLQNERDRLVRLLGGP